MSPAMIPTQAILTRAVTMMYRRLLTFFTDAPHDHPEHRCNVAAKQLNYTKIGRIQNMNSCLLGLLLAQTLICSAGTATKCYLNQHHSAASVSPVTFAVTAMRSFIQNLRSTVGCGGIGQTVFGASVQILSRKRNPFHSMTLTYWQQSRQCPLRLLAFQSIPFTVLSENANAMVH